MTTTETRHDDDVLEPVDVPSSVHLVRLIQTIVGVFDIARLGCSLLGSLGLSVVLALLFAGSIIVS